MRKILAAACAALTLAAPAMADSLAGKKMTGSWITMVNGARVGTSRIVFESDTFLTYCFTPPLGKEQCSPGILFSLQGGTISFSGATTSFVITPVASGGYVGKRYVGGKLAEMGTLSAPH
jgi:hypothetical protein